MILLLALAIPAAIPLTERVPAQSWTCRAWNSSGSESSLTGHFDAIEASDEQPIYHSPHVTGRVDVDTEDQVEGEYPGTYQSGHSYRLGDGRNFVEISITGSSDTRLLKVEHYAEPMGQPLIRVGFCRFDRAPGQEQQ